jgi:hypothetical protein
MKKFMILAVMMIATLTASAQQKVGTWSITPTGTFNLATIVGDNTDDMSMKVGLGAGADAMYQLSSLVGLSGGLYYSMQGANGKGDVKYNVDELLIPLMANFYVYPNLALKVGLQPGFIVDAKVKSDKVEVDSSDSFQSVEISLPLGISYEISNFVIGARYNLGLAKINKGNGSWRNSVLMFSLGYKIPLGRR